jgi:3-deoxy-manno-octulosonate cytidylyltransferase (CMP-KDO synthetase)
LEESTLEKIEKLEQVRWMENGYKIKLQETFLDTIGVDTQQDLDNIIKLIK